MAPPTSTITAARDRHPHAHADPGGDARRTPSRSSAFRDGVDRFVDADAPGDTEGRSRSRRHRSGGWLHRRDREHDEDPGQERHRAEAVEAVSPRTTPASTPPPPRAGAPPSSTAPPTHHAAEDRERPAALGDRTLGSSRFGRRRLRPRRLLRGLGLLDRFDRHRASVRDRRSSTIRQRRARRLS